MTRLSETASKRPATTAINSVYGTDDRHAYMGWRIAINVVNGTPLPWTYVTAPGADQ